ncbi:unnamed protein product [Caenorhabditis auriculariae]|uniref:Uncharacterized protein n=1 Tax=Caenorhabditis auriculariae TaxID=2777116 RepID=A0A8S1GPX4_9PELO|nr:unnamed protein product [Caenorhabditis auriculariae]
MLATLVSTPTMAFATPVVRRDFNLYERKKRSRTTSSKPSNSGSPKTLPVTQGTSLDSLLDRHQQLKQLRERRQQDRMIRRCHTITLRKISVITEDEEENDHESTLIEKICEELEKPLMTEDNLSHTTSLESTSQNADSTKNKKKSMMGLFNQWVRSHSFRRKKSEKSAPTY